MTEQKIVRKHTPGPWNENRDPATSWCDEEKISIEGGAMFIATVDHCIAQGANAKLIAAAPEMLDMLERAALQFRYYERAHREKGTEDSTRKSEVNAGLAYDIEQVIAKATGQ